MPPATPIPAPTPVATATPAPTPTTAATTPVTPAPTAATAPTATATPAPTPTPTPAPTATATATPTPTPTPTPAPDSSSVIEDAFARFNEGRQEIGLGALKLVTEDDASFTAVQEFVVGCHASVEEYEELQREDIDGIALSPSTGGSECGLKVVIYSTAAAPPPTETETPVATETPTPTPDPASIIEDAFSRFNEERQGLGLGALRRAVEGDDSFIPVQELLVGCNASVEEYEELQMEDLHGIGLSISTEGSECGLRVVTYHIVPVDQRMIVERDIWDCFTQSRDIREPGDVSCGGRYTFLGRHVKWLPKQILYFIEQGEGLRGRLTSHIPWIEEKLKVQVSEAGSSDAAHIILHLGVQSPANCPERYGCNVLEEVEDRTFANIYVSAPDEYFSQVLKHELLHALLPMGHLPEGNYLMSVRPEDPSQTQTLTPHEEKLLALYTHPYLRADMTMEQFRRYLRIE